MDFVLSHFLRLLQPVMPHIAEELWSTLGFRAPSHGTPYLMYVAWPEPGLLAGLDPERIACAKERVTAVYQSVRLARNLRSEYRIASNKKIQFFLKTDLAWAAEEIGTFARLINAEAVTIDPAYQPPRGVPRSLTPLGELYMPLEGLIDLAAELERLDKEIGKAEAELATVGRKLSSESFVQNAPAAVVAEHRKREAEWTEKLYQLKKMQQILGN